MTLPLSLTALTLASCGAGSGGLVPPGGASTTASVSMHPAKSYSVLYDFSAQVGTYGKAGLLEGAKGILYGTLSLNGAHKSGAVFELIPGKKGYTEKTLYSFRGGKDGADVRSTLVADKKGALYGTTFYGGNSACSSGCGTVFKLVPHGSGYKESVLYAFAGGNDGANPASGVLMDAKGNLYGTTYAGGGSASCSIGCGVVYRLVPTSSGYSEQILNEFVSGTDGANPVGGLAMDQSGALYGTTLYGGSSNCGGLGCGTVFKMTPMTNGYYSESPIYAFDGLVDGQSPEVTPLLDSSGAIYGTASEGGSSQGYGSFYKLVPSGSTYQLYTATAFNGTDGADPWAGLVALKNGAFAGVTTAGGAQNEGVVYEFKQKGSFYEESVLHSFKGGKKDGSAAYGTLLLAKDGMLYGTTIEGGKSGGGIVFTVKP